MPGKSYPMLNWGTRYLNRRICTSHVLTGTKILIEEINSVIYHESKRKREKCQEESALRNSLWECTCTTSFKNYNKKKKEKRQPCWILSGTAVLWMLVHSSVYRAHTCIPVTDLRTLQMMCFLTFEKRRRQLPVSSISVNVSIRSRRSLTANLDPS